MVGASFIQWVSARRLGRLLLERHRSAFQFVPTSVWFPGDWGKARSFSLRRMDREIADAEVQLLASRVRVSEYVIRIGLLVTVPVLWVLTRGAA
jgi:hypothetical protein